MARGTAQGFCHALAGQLRARFTPEQWPQVLVLVPTARVAARLRSLLSENHCGMLPAITPLRGSGELAELLGIAPPATVDMVVAKLELVRALRQHYGADEPVQGERLWRQADSLCEVLDRLAQHGITPAQLRTTLPPHMLGLWERQADVLLHMAQHMARWLAARGAMWPGEAERRILEQAAEVILDPASRWLTVVAGVVDGTPAAQAVIRAAATVLVPVLGPATVELAGRLQEKLAIKALEVPLPPVGLRQEAVAESEWDEAWVAALAVRRAVQAGVARVGVVSPSVRLMQRVAGLLNGWGLPVTVGQAGCLAATPLGRKLTAGQPWGARARSLSQWRELMATHGYDDEGTELLQEALLRVQGEEYRLDGADWQALLKRLLAVTPVAVAGAEGIVMLGPLEARLLDFDFVVACGCVEGTWPTPHSDSWLSEPHLRALGLPDNAHKALRMGTELESLLHGGHDHVLVTRAARVEGKETVRSRYLTGVTCQPDVEMVALAQRLRRGRVRAVEQLGAFVPQGSLWPKRWSASFVETLLACPYRALGERILKLAPPDPLLPQPDARRAGLLVHRWLERVGRAFLAAPPNDPAAMAAAMCALGEDELAKEEPVVRAIWRGKFAKLAPALAAQWHAQGRGVAGVEQKLAKDVGGVTVAATLDRVEADAAGAVIVDFKTGTPPAWSSVAAGIKPQLALEAWLMEADVAAVEYWQLRGYGTKPLEVKRAEGAQLDKLLAPVEQGVARLVEAYREGQTFAALPDPQGGGLQATGHCTTCNLAGVCRRKGAVHA